MFFVVAYAISLLEIFNVRYWLVNFIDMLSGYEISDASYHTRVVDSYVLNVVPLAIIHPSTNIIVLNDSYESREFCPKRQ